MEEATDPHIKVRPFAGRSDFERMIDYLLGADEGFLRGMGVDPQKLPDRQAWLGTQYFRASAAEFMRAFRLKRLYCEPYAENPGPNRVLLKSGFRFIRRYWTVPGPINFEQDVNQYVLESRG